MELLMVRDLALIAALFSLLALVLAVLGTMRPRP